MRHRAYRTCLSAVTAACLFTVLYGEHEASACGGCFTVPPSPMAPPESVDSVITGERMIFSISKDQTTLYDEITYSGNPSSFAWVLPIKGEVEVGLSADILFATIDQLTAATVVAPPENCPAPPTTCGVFSGGGGGGCGFGSTNAADFAGGGFASAAEDAGGGGDSGVTVLTQGQVGPYEMVQLKSTDGSALTKWLDKNGYRVAKADAPVIAHYVSAGMDFLALKLIPGVGVSAMQPVRVTTKGAYPVLPLRMVGVGTGATTGITLWVVADGRWEPQNFPFFTIDSSELTWDWKSSSSNYESLRLAKEGALAGRGWQIESSLDLSQYSIQNALSAAIAQNGYGVGGYSEPTPVKPPPPPGGKDAGKGTPEAGGHDASLDAGDDATEVDGGEADDGASANDGDVTDASEADGGAPVDTGVADAAPAEAAPPADAGSPLTDADVDGSDSQPSEQELGQDDLAVLLAGIARPNARITRLRSDVSHSALSDDLVIQAAADQGELSNTYTTSQETGQPQCPVYDANCLQVGNLPRDQAKAYATANYASYGGGGNSASGCDCKTPAGTTSPKSTFGVMVGLVGLGMFRSRRRRRSRRP
jgi:MYXO-CTERM domain-containing protein